MALSPTASSHSSSSSSSSTSNSTLNPNHLLSPAYRRRSVDTGGLNLALNDHSGSGSGKGWGGWEAGPMRAASGSIDYAELVLAMREQTNTAIDHAYPATSTTLRSSSELEAQRESLIQKLGTWHFDASHLPPDEVLLCASLLFETLWSIEGMEDSVGFTFDSIPPFLARISKIYRAQTSYHNFQHALDVLQAVHCYLHHAGCVPSTSILLGHEQDVFVSASQADEGKGKGKATPASNVVPPEPRRRRIWRRPPPDREQDTLLQRTLRNQDLFALYVAGIGHDIGHPGLSNTFMKNAKTPLAELFDDKSVLEKLHCTLIIQVMRKHRMGHLLDKLPSRLPHQAPFSSSMQSRPRTESDPGILNRNTNRTFALSTEIAMEPIPPATPRPFLKKSASVYAGSSDATTGTGTEFRNLLHETILATDMSVHFKWMLEIDELWQKLERCEDGELDPEEVDPQTRLLLCQALIKCADISNPSRPPPICRHWSRSLLAEWTEQALLEKQLALPISITASDDPIEEAEGQIGFIGTFTLPLLKATSAVIPEMDVFVKQCESNLLMWGEKIKASHSKVAVKDTASSGLKLHVYDSPASATSSLPTSPPDVSTMFALSLPQALYTPYSEPRTQPSWPVTDPSRSPLLTRTRTEIDVEGHDRAEVPTPPDSRSPSPPSAPSHRRQTSSHTQLPQVSIPNHAPAIFSPSNWQHVKSSSTTSASAPSPLFSPHSIPTSSSSPRSDISSAGSGAMSAVALQLRPGLRAAYDANERPKATKRLENRTSWQGTVAVTTASSAMGSDSDSDTAQISHQAGVVQTNGS